MKPPKRKPSPARINIPLGLIQWGDLGHWTTYRTHKGKLVWFPKTWPKKPPSPAQTAERAKFKAIINAWNNLTPDQKAAYNRAIRKLSLCITPVGLKIALDYDPNNQLRSTIERQSAETLA